MAKSNWSLSTGYLHANSTYPTRASLKTNIEFNCRIKDEDMDNMCTSRVRSDSYLISFHLPNEVATIFHEFNVVEIGKSRMINLNAKYYTTDRYSLEGFSPMRRKCYFEGNFLVLETIKILNHIWQCE